MAEQPEPNRNTIGRTTTSRERWVGECRALATHVRPATEAIARSTLSSRSSGQIVALFAISIIAMVALLGMIIDGGNVYVQRRTVQNAADAASLAGTRALMKATVRSDSTIAAAVCQYIGANTFGTTPTATASFVDTTGAVIGGSPQLLPANCTGTQVNSIPDAAAGVNVNANISFKTYLAGIVGFPQATTAASAAVQGAAVTAFQAKNSPFIICGVDTTLVAGGTQSILKMIDATNPVSPAQINPAAVGLDFVIHGPSITSCDASSGFHGFADNTGLNNGISSLPADVHSLTGVRAATVQTAVDGFSGCAAGQGNNCVMIVPVAIPGTGRLSDGNPGYTCVLWAAFRVTSFPPNIHHAQLLAGYSVGGGPESFTWTWGTRDSVSTTAMGLTH